MHNKVKDIDIKNHTYCFFNDSMNIKSFDPNTFKVDEKLYKGILIYYIGYVMIKISKCVIINNVNPLYLIFIKVNGYSEEINGNKYLKLVRTNETLEKIKKYEEMWIKNQRFNQINNLKLKWLWWKIYEKSNLTSMMNYLEIKR